MESHRHLPVKANLAPASRLVFTSKYEQSAWILCHLAHVKLHLFHKRRHLTLEQLMRLQRSVTLVSRRRTALSVFRKSIVTWKAQVSAYAYHGTSFGAYSAAISRCG